MGRRKEKNCVIFCSVAFPVLNAFVRRGGEKKKKRTAESRYFPPLPCNFPKKKGKQCGGGGRTWTVANQNLYLKYFKIPGDRKTNGKRGKEKNIADLKVHISTNAPGIMRVTEEGERRGEGRGRGHFIFTPFFQSTYGLERVGNRKEEREEKKENGQVSGPN